MQLKALFWHKESFLALFNALPWNQARNTFWQVTFRNVNGTSKEFPLHQIDCTENLKGNLKIEFQVPWAKFTSFNKTQAVQKTLPRDNLICQARLICSKEDFDCVRKRIWKAKYETNEGYFRKILDMFDGRVPHLFKISIKIKCSSIKISFTFSIELKQEMKSCFQF